MAQSFRMILLAAAVMGAAATRTAGAGATDPLVEDLRAGGLVLLVRRAEVGPGARDPQGRRDCTRHPKLTWPGWVASITLGMGLRKQRIFIETAWSMPSCGARQTAQLAFGSDRLVAHPALARLCAGGNGSVLASVLRSPRDAGVNQVVVLDGCAFAAIAKRDWGACARAPEPAGVVVVKRIDGGLRPTGCLSPAVLRAWRNRPEDYRQVPRFRR